MKLSKIARVGVLALALTALAPATAAFAQTVEDTTPEVDTFCVDYQARYDAMVKLNDRLSARYDAAVAAAKTTATTTAAATPDTKVKGKSADHRPDKAGKTASGDRKAKAILSVQNRLAARSAALADRVASECGGTLTPIAALKPAAA